MVILPIALVLIAVPVILLTVGGRDSATQKDAVSAMSVSGEGMVEVTPVATAVATPVPTQAPFDFDRAYVSAVKKRITLRTHRPKARPSNPEMSSLTLYLLSFLLYSFFIICLFTSVPEMIQQFTDSSEKS